MSTVKAMELKVLEVLANAAMKVAYSIFGRLCRTFFYEPAVPQKLLDMDN